MKHVARFVQSTLLQSLCCQTYCTAYTVNHVAQFIPFKLGAALLFFQSNMLQSCMLSNIYNACKSDMFQSLCCQAYCRAYTIKMLHSLYALQHVAGFVQLNMFQNLLCQKYCKAYTIKHIAQFMPSNWLQVVLSIKHVA